jgi:hypothetical protein
MRDLVFGVYKIMDRSVNKTYQLTEKVIFLRLLKNASRQGRDRAPASLSPAVQAGNPESGVATNKERLLATPASW